MNKKNLSLALAITVVVLAIIMLTMLILNKNQISPQQNKQITTNGSIMPNENKVTNSQNKLEGKLPLRKIKEDGSLVYYDGNVIISGVYKELHPETLLGELLCFTADEESAYLIPRDPNLFGEGNGDMRKPWFCFADQIRAKEIFEINDSDIFKDKEIDCIQGKATIEISNYIVNRKESSVVDSAILEKIISKESYTTQCAM